MRSVTDPPSQDPPAPRLGHTPHDPPLAEAAAGEFSGGYIGPELEDFVVEERPLYEPCGSGPHHYVLLEKRGWNTQDAVRALARAAGVAERDVGSAGLKDRQGVTRQWLSLPESPEQAPPDTWRLPDGLALLRVSRHQNKLRTGHLRGNAFRIRLVDVEPDALPRAQARLARLCEQGLFNYYDVQRFGRAGGNLGRALALVHPAAGSRGRRPQRFELRLLASSLQSEVFNRYLSARRAADLSRPLHGEVVRLAGTGTTFVVQDRDAELPRWRAKDLVPTGPLPGPRCRPAEADALALETQVLQELGLQGWPLPAELARLTPGSRRDLWVFPADARVTQPEAGSLLLEFELPAGSYATRLVQEISGRSARRARTTAEPEAG